MAQKASCTDNAKANTNHMKEMNTGVTAFLRPSRRLFASSVRILAILYVRPSDHYSSRMLLNSINLSSRFASIGGQLVLDESVERFSRSQESCSNLGKCIHWFITQRIKSESLINENSESSLGSSSYLVAVSTINAHLLVALMFQNRQDKLAIGFLTHQLSTRKAA